MTSLAHQRQSPVVRKPAPLPAPASASAAQAVALLRIRQRDAAQARLAGKRVPQPRQSLCLAMLCMTIGSLLLGWTAMGVTGCHTADPGPVYPPLLTTIPDTQFTPPPVVPSPTPPTAAATTQATRAADLARATRDRVAALTRENLQHQQQDVLALAGSTLGAMGELMDRLAEARALAAANDAAVLLLNGELVKARALVGERERDIREREERHAGELRTLQKDHAKEIKARDDRIEHLVAENDSKAKAFTNLLFGAGAGLGGILIVSGAVMFVFVTPKANGIVVSGVGIIVGCLGMAGVYYGREIAIAGMALGAVTVVAAIWIAIRQLRADSGSIVQGVAQAIAAGKIQLADVREHFDMAQTPGAKALVDAETK